MRAQDLSNDHGGAMYRLKVYIQNRQKVAIDEEIRAVIRSCCAQVLTDEQFRLNAEVNVTFVDDDEVTVLYETVVKKGEVPVYEGEEPTKESTAKYTYAWTGWNPAIEAATQDQTYVATYTSIPRTYTITWKNSDGSVIKEDT